MTTDLSALLDGQWHCTGCERTWAEGDAPPECDCGGFPFRFGGLFQTDQTVGTVGSPDHDHDQ